MSGRESLFKKKQEYIVEKLKSMQSIPFQLSLWLLIRNDELKDSNASPALPLPVLGRRVKLFQNVKGLGCVVELTHSVALVGNQLYYEEKETNGAFLGTILIM
jgi:hypothetical protein